jgi:hypothetical protein
MSGRQPTEEVHSISRLLEEVNLAMIRGVPLSQSIIPAGSASGRFYVPHLLGLSQPVFPFACR